MRKNEYTKLEKTLISILQNLTEQSDEDCPQEYRSRHFKDALEDAKYILHLNPNPNPTK